MKKHNEMFNTEFRVKKKLHETEKSLGDIKKVFTLKKNFLLLLMLFISSFKTFTDTHTGMLLLLFVLSAKRRKLKKLTKTWVEKKDE